MLIPHPYTLAFSIALLCGIIMPFAFAPYAWVFLALGSLTTWLLLILRYPQLSFRLGWIFGFGWFGFGAWWLADTFQTYGHIPYAVALIAVAVIGLVLGSIFGLWSWLLTKLSRHETDILWLFPLIGTFIEWLRSFLFTGLPWTALGNLALDTPLANWISIIGSYGVTFLILLIISSLVLLKAVSTRKIGLGGLALCALFMLTPPAIEVPEQPSHTVALIQPNISQDQKWDSAFVRHIMQTLVSLSEKAGDVDLIVWPEAAVPVYLTPTTAWSIWLHEQVRNWKTPLIFGGLKLMPKTGSDDIKSQNGLFLTQGDIENNSFVGKHHLVPFGEYVPSWVPWIEKIVPDIGDFEPATDTGVLTLDDQVFGSIICYESIFPEQSQQRITQGVNVLIVVTNDAWYAKSPAAWQHLQASQVRALETGRYVLRATNTGISAIISPDGKVQKSMDWWQAGFVTGRYQPLNHITPYQRWGNSPILILVFLGLGFALFRLYRGK